MSPARPPRRWRARRDSNPRPSASKPFELLCQILPEEWLIERNQQVGANSSNLLSPSFVAVCRIFAAAFRTLRYIFVTVARFRLQRRIAAVIRQIVVPCKPKQFQAVLVF